ncbi:MAG: hypothetical protein CMI56_00605 [Parcubacteria group bacterium]|nr:hypothetical protein [Parcubacteria group bacterium]|tara:strand:- start:2531 stop:3496 length:966 start_codon:yes stop_codon:yes gene_type:complete
MNERIKATPKDFFLWLGAMVALYLSVGSVVAVTFEYIERLVGSSSIIGYDPYSGGMQFAIASLIVVFPVYIILTRILNQDIRRNPEKKELWIRRWLVFLTVFLAGLALVIDLIVLLYTFLGGEQLTAAFLLKVVTIFVLFAGIFYYYLKDIHGYWENNEKQSKMVGGGVALVVLMTIISGFVIMGSPATQRALREDDQRIRDLQGIQSQVTEYYRTTEELPNSLEDLKDPLVGAYIQNDPATGEPYEYTATGKLTFELCATFALPLPEFNEKGIDPSDWRVRDLQQKAEDWGHGEGRTCFERTIDPDRVKPYKELNEALRF